MPLFTLFSFQMSWYFSVPSRYLHVYKWIQSDNAPAKEGIFCLTIGNETNTVWIPSNTNFTVYSVHIVFYLEKYFLTIRRPVHTMQFVFNICFVPLCWNKRDNLRISEFEKSCVQLIGSCKTALLCWEQLREGVTTKPASWLQICHRNCQFAELWNQFTFRSGRWFVNVAVRDFISQALTNLTSERMYVIGSH